MKKIFIILLASFAFTKAFAGLNEGVAAYEASNFSRALKEFAPLAKQGDSVAQYNLGIMYEQGQGTSKNLIQAFKWLKVSAEQGYVPSQNKVGLIYQYGRGIGQSYDEALKWYKSAAAQGNAAAQNNLGVMYDNGWGMKDKDVQMAFICFRSASQLGDPVARTNVNAILARSPLPVPVAALLADEQSRSNYGNGFLIREIYKQQTGQPRPEPTVIQCK